MSRQRTRLDSWEWDKQHRERVIAKAQKIQTLRALLEMWEEKPDEAGHDYILELRARLRSAENQFKSFSFMKLLTRFGRLVVVERAGSSRQGKAKWKCRCDCGKEKIILAYSLKSGSTQSCGCLHREIVIQRGRKAFKWEKAGDCIICTSHKATNGTGYPVLNYYGKRPITISRAILLHRLKVKSSPLFALHLCDNKKCINPAHIVGGTHQENMDQMVSRGRTIGIRVGERNGHASLKESDVQAIRQNKGILSPEELAARYGTTPANIVVIWRNLTWKHVTV